MHQICPSCGLSVSPRRFAITYCPRCIAQRRAVVELQHVDSHRAAPASAAPLPPPGRPAPRRA